MSDKAKTESATEEPVTIEVSGVPVQELELGSVGLAVEIIADLKKQLEEAKGNAKVWEENWNVCHDYNMVLSRQSDIISYILKLDNIRSLDMIWGWLYEFFCFSLCTGMRLNEITALKWQDIDYINNVIRVNKTVSWKEGGGIEETLPKSDTSNRDIPMNDTIKKILQMQKTKMSMVYGEIHARKMDSNIFIGSNGAKAIASSTVSSAIDNVLKRLRQQGIEIERFTHHAFRDTFATRYVEEGGNMQTLQKILGHSSLAMTADLYAHVLPNTKQQEMQQIENGFIGVAVL